MQEKASFTPSHILPPKFIAKVPFKKSLAKESQTVDAISLHHVNNISSEKKSFGNTASKVWKQQTRFY